MPKPIQIAISQTRHGLEQFGHCVAWVLLDDGRIFENWQRADASEWSEIIGPWAKKETPDAT